MDDPGIGSSFVEYGMHRSGLNQVKKGTYKAFVDGGKLKRTQYIHRVSLKNLEPDTSYCRYTYRNKINTRSTRL